MWPENANNNFILCPANICLMVEYIYTYNNNVYFAVVLKITFVCQFDCT